MMLLTIPISPDAEARLKAKAAAAGVDVETYAGQQLEMVAARPRTLKEILAAREDVLARTGMTEDELSDFLEAEKHAMRAEQRENRSE